MDGKMNNDIKEIISRLSSDKSGETEIPEVKSGGLVFEFVEETDDNHQTDKPQTSTIKPKPKAEEIPPQKTEEFSIPDVFEVSDKYNTPATEDITARIWTTYVPKFTEVSETYRMINDPRPKRESAASIVAESVDNPTDAQQSELDPTAEIENNTVDAVIVKTSQEIVEENTETLNVYKFDDTKPSPIQQKTEDDEAEELIKLVKGEDRPSEPNMVSEKTATEPAVEEIFDDQASEEGIAPADDKVYDIPDPEREDLEVVDYSTQPAQLPVIAEPEGVSNLPAEAPQKNTEFTHRTQRDGFKDKFLDGIMSVKIRMFAAACFSFLLLVYETLASFKVLESSVTALAVVPGAVAVVDLLFAVCIFALALPETVKAVRSLFFGRVTSDLILIPGLLVVAAYSLTIAFSGARRYMLFGFIYAILVISVILGTYFRVASDFIAFKFISKNNEKKIIDKKLTRTLPEENIALDGLVDEYKSRTARIFRAGFISDFFKRIAKNEEKNSQTLTIISVSLGAAIVTAFVCFFVAGGLTSAITAFAMVFLLGCPAISVLSHKLPYFDAQRAALAEDSTVIGETSLLSFSDVDVVAFEDSEIFGPDDVNLRRIMLYGDRDNMEKVMRQMCSLFSAVGGPLDYIFANALDNRVRHSPASDIIIEDDGVSGNVAGRRIAAGSEEYMRRNGIAIPEGSARSDSGIDTTKIMYASENGEVHAKFYIRYSFSEEFTMLLPTLKDKGVVPLVYTRDPNISNELLHTLTAGSDCMRVMKKHTLDSEQDVLYRSVSAGIVTYGDKINAINVILLTKKYKKFGAYIANLELYAMGAGAVLGILLSLFGIINVPSVILGLWQCLWCVVLSIAGKNTFND